MDSYKKVSENIYDVELYKEISKEIEKLFDTEKENEKAKETIENNSLAKNANIRSIKKKRNKFNNCI